MTGSATTEAGSFFAAIGFVTGIGVIPLALKYEGGIMKCLRFFFLHQK
ncbi:hypothetical protein ADIWIN_1324 [Winogradskyella psychrotolerans RS-3]|uniref:Uncharacterized protein n=1 Tax=Winogradskyella psychrotolerans RS-3 TaxID=641526 RepID=S7VWE2_9FLAO|nr:hypothetical protein ADIWIN_1324 [Winogradskyella psychrotolerans RS-3]